MMTIKRQVIIVSILFLILLTGALGSAVLLPSRLLEEERVIDIQEGQTVDTIARNLKQIGVIKNSEVFTWLVWLSGRDDDIRSGHYIFNEGQSLLRVVLRVTRGDYGFDPVKITIPEGFSATDIAGVFSKGFSNIKNETLLTLAEKEEGYLFPDTYFFYPSVKAEEVIRTMKDNFKAKVGRVKSEDIIMASLLEKEVKTPKDKAMVAGILWKRLNKGMRLEVDAAPVTYRSYGLPPSPIANPGLESIYAAQNPVESPYWFYLSGKDGTTHYAKTFEEHKANKAKYL